ncbi:hemagglutinin repeat-containing protein [Erwinia tracheiphila]|uniref:Filamentous haemagglutinin FhaB/tRNA nuclease CdiA-like TPS domain-containing protein n=3 Tax=Erwinia tracheiphila TaxID=65700 RepID=A0A0M2KG05_9GAMM|nr:hemagglutinin repeat-containing protein [Erwinia tracheiphila]KKF36277.1 hypothetical protein SY86_13865 [Erwinia tracheiphila]UIA87601.1 hemagglutinin repeat-containing protein [Erwinia tracheiphila]UIA95965.1 hemagglutinin repeat-containing protein [Erwinia tracheiphila]
MKNKKKLSPYRTTRNSIKVSPLVLAMAGILPSMAVAEIVVDDRESRRPGVATAANGTPLININDPNASGVSHNKYNQFNVGRDGVIFNNSMQDGVSQTGGFAIKNNQLSNESRVILNEVTGARGSHLNGSMEVFGRSADLIIANENGISVNGVSTVNANNLTLSTGRVNLDQNGNVQLAVDRGHISVEGRGVNTDGLSYFDIVSRSASLTGEISGNADLKVLAGLNDYDTQSRSHTVRSHSGEGTPQVAISGTHLGSMFGNRVQLISTESGAGVTHTGSILGNNGIEITADGDIHLASLRSHSENVVVQGKSIYLNNNAEAGIGGIAAQGDVILTALSDMELNANVIAETGQIRINANNLLQSAAVLMAKNGTRATGAIPAIEINVAGRYQIRGALYAVDSNGNRIPDAVVNISNGKFVVKVGSQVLSNVTVYSDASLMSTSGDIAINAGSVENNQGSLITNRGNLIFTLSDSLINSGMVQANGSVQLRGARLKNAGIINTTDAIKLTLGRLDNSGSMYAGRIAVSTDAFTNSGMLLTRDGDLSLKANGIANSGTLQSSASVKVEGQELDNAGVIFASEKIDIAVENNLQNAGKLYTDDMTIASQSLNNQGDIIAEKGNISLATQEVVNSGAIQSNTADITTAGALINQGIIGTSTSLNVNAKDLSNSNKLISEGNLTLNVNNEIVNSGSDAVISARKDLEIAGTDKNTLNVKNKDNAFIQSAAGDVVIKNIASLENTNASIVTNNGIDISDAGVFQNNDGHIQGRDVNFTHVGEINNQGANANIIANSVLNMNSVNILSNSGNLASQGDVNISHVDVVKNNAGNITATRDITFSSVNDLENSNAASISSHYGSVLFTTLKNLRNLSDSVIEARNSISVAHVDNVSNGAGSVLQSQGSMTFSDIQTLDNAGSLLTSLDLILTGLDSFINRGQFAEVSGLNIIVSKISNMINRDYALLIADDLLKISDVENFKNILTPEYLQAVREMMSSDEFNQFIREASTYIQANNIEMDVGTLTSSGVGSLIVADKNLRVNASQILNSDSATLAADNQLSFTTDSLVNNDGFIDGASYHINAKELVNKGQISSSDSRGISTITADSVDNSQGRIYNAGSLTLKTAHLDNSDTGYIWGNRELALELQGAFNNADHNIIGSGAGGQLSIKTTGDVTIDKAIESRSTVSIDSKNITNNAAVVSLQDVYLVAENIINSTNSLIFAMNNIVMSARDTILNKVRGNILSQGQIALTANTIHNHAGVIRSEDNMWLDANTLYNQSTYTGEDWDYSARESGGGVYDERATGVGRWYKYHYVDISIPGLTSDIALDTRAEISSGGNLYINQKSERPGVTKNEGGLIQARENLHIRGDLYNSPKHLEMSLYDYLTANAEISLTYVHWATLSSEERRTQTFSNLFALFNTIFGSGQVVGSSADKGKYLNAMKMLADSHTMFNSLMNNLFGETWKSRNLNELTLQWLSLSQANVGGASLSYPLLKAKKIYFLPAEKASLVAGGNFVHTEGSLNNGLDSALAGNDVSNQVVDAVIGDQTVSTVEQSYEVQFNKKQIAEISMGISTLPGVAELLEINALFQRSQDFLDYLASLNKASNNAGGGAEGSSGVSTGSRGNHTVIPMYETRIEMIDQNLFYGSQYFFDTVGYNAEQPAIVIGDNYFITELIRRQVNDSVGTYFSVKYNVDGADAVKMLFDNAAEQSANGDFVIGQALTEEQMAGLTQDIVWFVTETIDGIDVLVPRIYLASSTIEEIRASSETGAAIISAGANVIVDATEINNVNAVITAGDHVVLDAEKDINNISSGMNAGISAGGSVAMTSETGNITNSGSSISAGEHVILSAEEGSIDLMTSVGRDNKGNQSIGAYDDGITAGGSVQMTAKDIDITAVDITAGNAVMLKATEGNVNFNDIHEVSSTYDYQYESTGFMSYRAEENISTTGSSKTSSVNAGGAFIVDGAQDVVFSGGDYNASAASISAGNDVVIKTSQDVSYAEKNVTESEFVFGASYQVPGAQGGTSFSTLDSVKRDSTGLDSSGAGSTPMGNDAYQDYTNDNGYTAAAYNLDRSASAPKKTGAAPVAPLGSFEAGLKTTSTITTETSVTNNNANFNFANGADISAGNTLDIGGLNLSVGNDTTANLSGDNIISTKYKDVHKTTEDVTTTFVGVKGEANSTAVDILNKNVDLAEQAASGKKIDAGLTTASVVGDVSNLVFNDLAAASTSIGYSSTTTSNSAMRESDNMTSITGGTINFDSNKDTTLKGVNVEAGTVNIDVGGDFSISAAEEKYNGTSSSYTNSAGLSFGGGVAASGAGVGASIDYSHSESSSSVNSLTNTNSQITADNVNVSTGGNMSMSGANIEAGQASLDIGGDLSITSVQDTYSESSDGYNTAVSVGASISTKGVTPNGGINGGVKNSYYDSQLTNQQSGIKTNGEVNINVGGDMELAGAHVASENNSGSVNVDGNIYVTEINDSIDSGGMAVGGGGGITKSGNINVNAYYSTEDKIDYKESQNSTINVNVSGSTINGNINTDVDKMSEVTMDTVTAGNDISFTVSAGGKKKNNKSETDGKKPDAAPVNNSGQSSSQTPGGSSAGKPGTAGSGGGTQNATQTSGSSSAGKPGTAGSSGGAQNATQTPGSSSAGKPGTAGSGGGAQNAIQTSGSSSAGKPGTAGSSGGAQNATQTPGGSSAGKPGTAGSSGAGQNASGATGGTKWPTVPPVKPIVGGPGSASSTSGNYAGNTKPANNSPSQNATQTPGSSSAGKPGTAGSSGAGQNASGATGGTKWPTVPPVKPIVGGPGSASSTSGNYAGNTKPANNSPSQNATQTPGSSAGKPGTAGSSGAGQNASGATGGTKWPTVPSVKPIVGGPGSASSTSGNYAGNTKPANNSPSQNATQTPRSGAGKPGTAGSSGGAQNASGAPGGTKWPTVPSVKPIVGGPGSASSTSGNYAGNTKPANNSPSQNATQTPRSGAGKPGTAGSSGGAQNASGAPGGTKWPTVPSVKPIVGGPGSASSTSGNYAGNTKPANNSPSQNATHSSANAKSEAAAGNNWKTLMNNQKIE